MRPDGLPDIPLDKDWDEALDKWDELYNKKLRIKGTMEEAFPLWEQEKLPEYENPETRRRHKKSLKWCARCSARPSGMPLS
jgi:hypothetical protein